jgi:hypothetical protein
MAATGNSCFWLADFKQRRQVMTKAHIAFGKVS